MSGFLTTLLGAFPHLAPSPTTNQFGGTAPLNPSSGLLGLIGDAGGLIDPNDPLVGLLQLAGVIGQGYVSQQQLDWANAITDKQKRSIDIGQDPTRLSAQTQALTHPMSGALKRNVLEPVQAQLGLQGMATAPTIQQYVSEQALAPYYLQEQQMGEEAALRGLHFPFETSFNWPTFAASGGDPGTGATVTDPFTAFVDQIMSGGTGNLTNVLGGTTSGGITDPFASYLNSLTGGGINLGPAFGGFTL
jgi:hypothetical protein